MLRIRVLHFFLLSFIAFSLHAMTEQEGKEEIINLASQGILASVKNLQGKALLDKLKYFLSEGGLPDKYKDDQGNTALMIEIKKDNPAVEVVKLLLDAGANPHNYLHTLFADVLHQRQNIPENTLMSLVTPQNINEEDKLGNTLLFIVMPDKVSNLEKSFSFAQQLLFKGADPNKSNKDGQTPLHRLLSFIPLLEDRKNYEDLKQFITLLLNNGANPNVRPTLWRWKREKNKPPYKQEYAGPVKSPFEYLDSLYKALKQSKIEKIPGQIDLQKNFIEDIKKQIASPIKTSLPDLLSSLIESLSSLKQALKH